MECGGLSRDGPSGSQIECLVISEWCYFIGIMKFLPSWSSRCDFIGDTDEGLGLWIFKGPRQKSSVSVLLLPANTDVEFSAASSVHVCLCPFMLSTMIIMYQTSQL